jgi:hypothetical protein
LTRVFKMCIIRSLLKSIYIIMFLYIVFIIYIYINIRAPLYKVLYISYNLDKDIYIYIYIKIIVREPLVPELRPRGVRRWCMYPEAAYSVS